MLLKPLSPRASGQITLEQPVLKPEGELGLKRLPGTKASAEYARQQGRPIRYLLRDANYFIVRRASQFEPLPYPPSWLKARQTWPRPNAAVSRT